MLDYSKIKIGIIDLKINNIFSLFNSLKKIGYKVNIVEKNFKNFDYIILPGVGSFRAGMDSLRKRRLDKDIFEQIVLKKRKLIGICLGMQLLFNDSCEFGKTKGLGLINGSVKKFNDKICTVPMVGWYKAKSTNKFIKRKNFYHIHSYYCKPKNKKIILSNTSYFKINYCSAVHEKNIIAFQFHPEKSGLDGINLLGNIPNFF